MSFQRLLLLVFLFIFQPCRGLQERTVVLLYNKPEDVVTSHALQDVKGRRNVYQDVCSMQGYVGPSLFDDRPTSFAEVTGIRSRLHAVGRLDAETTGALLLTNDGGLVHHVTNRDATGSRRSVAKTYEAIIMGRHSNDSEIFHQMRQQGVDIGQKYGGWTRPVNDVHVTDHPTQKSTKVSITISEGKNRQIRRMFHAVGSGVMKLKRTFIGKGLGLGDLQEGQWRILADEEVQSCLYYTPRSLQKRDEFQEKKTANGRGASQRWRETRAKRRKRR